MPNSGKARPVALHGQLACVADGPSGFEVLDVGDPAFPRRVGGAPLAGGADAITIAALGGQLLVADDNHLTLLNPFIPLHLDAGARRLDVRHLSLTSPPDLPVRIPRSTDLATWQDWQNLTTRADTVVGLSDPGTASQPKLFYRAVAP